MSAADDEGLVLDEDAGLIPDSACEIPSTRDRVGLWRDAKAFEVHAALMSIRAAAQAVDVCLARLMRLMGSVSGYRRWGTAGFASYIMDDLRQGSPRRFRYLVAIDRAIVERPLPRLGEAWRRGRVALLTIGTAFAAVITHFFARGMFAP